MTVVLLIGLDGNNLYAQGNDARNFGRTAQTASFAAATHEAYRSGSNQKKTEGSRMDSRPPLDHARSTSVWKSVSLVCIAAMAMCLAPEAVLAAAPAEAGDGSLPMWVRVVAIVVGLVVIAAFAWLVLRLGLAFLRAVEVNRDSIGVHSNWGGFGGGLGGWSLSHALSLLLAILLLGSITYGLTEAVMGGVKSTGGGDKTQQTSEERQPTRKTGEQKSGEQKAGQQAADQKAADQKAAAEKTAGQKAADEKTGDQKAAEQKSADQKKAGQASTGQKAAEPDSAEESGN